MSFTLKEIYEQNTKFSNYIIKNPVIEDGSLLTSLEFILKVLS